MDKPVAMRPRHRRIMGHRPVLPMPHPLETDSTEHPPAMTARWIDLVERILLCGRVLRDEIRLRLQRWEVSESEFSLLWACKDAPSSGRGQNELAKVLAVSPAQVSAMVEQLRRKRLLRGRRATGDRRRQLWRLTPAGQTTVEVALAGLSDWTGGLDKCVGEGHALLLGQILDHLVQQFAAAPPPLADECKESSSSSASGETSAPHGARPLRSREAA
jgi:DNA-binding MarR family transcriptional regulator